jgi:hypothetical protein
VTTPTKEQVIAAVEAEIDWSTQGTNRIKPVALIALRRLAGKPRVSPQNQEKALLVGRVGVAGNQTRRRSRPRLLCRHSLGTA